MKDIDILLKKLRNTLTEEEDILFQKWLKQSASNGKLYEKLELLKKEGNGIQVISSVNIEAAWKKVQQKANSDSYRNKQNQKTIRLYNRNWFKYAAAAVILLGLGYFIQQNILKDNNQLIIPNENITLQLDNGTIEIINEDGSKQVVDAEGNVVGEQKGNQLVYDSDVVKEELVYNTLTVPYGKRFQVALSDGTLVHLNAGTSLKYPVKFINGENRQVYLDGEAYFEVTKDSTHPFVVNADEVDVRVLGTKFNISSYPEDNNINTVLLEGSVALYNKDEVYNTKTATLLTPNHKAAFNKTNKEINIEQTDVAIHTAWMEGRLILDEIHFGDILKKLERQYNVKIINNNPALLNRQFTATFDIEDINQVMESLSNSASFSYKVKNNTIIIGQ